MSKLTHLKEQQQLQIGLLFFRTFVCLREEEDLQIGTSSSTTQMTCFLSWTKLKEEDNKIARLVPSSSL